jgi:hypothetical protein
MTTLLSQTKTFSSPLVTIPLLGTAVDVTTHLKGSENVKLRSVSRELKVIYGSAYQTPFDVLSDRDHCVVLELSPDGSGACSLAHYGSMFTIKSHFGSC